MKVVILKREAETLTIPELIQSKKIVTDMVHDLEKLNKQQQHDAAFMQQLENVIIRSRKNAVRPE